MIQTGRSRVRFLMSMDFFDRHNHSSRTMILRSNQRMEGSTCNVLTMIFGWTQGSNDDCHHDNAANDYDDDGAAGSLNCPLHSLPGGA
jgi:hypothetical protein